jgi:hypothetical protein
MFKSDLTGRLSNRAIGGIGGLLCDVRLRSGLFYMDVQNIKRVGEFVSHFHTPSTIGLELAIQTLQSLTSHNSCFFPSRVMVRKILAFVIELGLMVIDVKKVSRHLKAIPLSATGSA